MKDSIDSARYGYLGSGENGPFIIYLLKEMFAALTAETVCRVRGHDLVDCGAGGPDSGYIYEVCQRCGRSWHYSLY